MGLFTCSVCGTQKRMSPSMVAKTRTCGAAECRKSYFALYEHGNAGMVHTPAHIASRTLSGPDSPHWKGGVDATKPRRQQSTKAYREWQSAVFTRDNHTCQGCGKARSLLVEILAHHILYWDERPDLRYTPSNGVSLCRPCHRRVHSGSLKLLPPFSRPQP